MAVGQQLVGRLPARPGYALYYFIQRRFGPLRSTDPMSRLRAGVELIDHFRALNASADDRAFLEIGTGRRLNLPIALWLCGASNVTTVDLNPYLKPELIAEDLIWIKNNVDSVRSVFGAHAAEPRFQQRLQQLLDVEPHDAERLMTTTNIHALAPVDARRLTGIEPATFDYHVSHTVAEHIPPDVLRDIFREGSRVLKPGGLFVFLIDLSDHFSHYDPSISPINFLRFSERSWSRWAGNRFMYHNRLRLDELIGLLDEAGLEVVLCDPTVDEHAVEVLRSGMKLDARFRGKADELNATTAAFIAARVRRS